MWVLIFEYFCNGEILIWAHFKFFNCGILFSDVFQEQCWVSHDFIVFVLFNVGVLFNGFGESVGAWGYFEEDAKLIKKVKTQWVRTHSISLWTAINRSISSNTPFRISKYINPIFFICLIIPLFLREEILPGNNLLPLFLEAKHFSMINTHQQPKITNHS